MTMPWEGLPTVDEGDGSAAAPPQQQPANPANMPWANATPVADPPPTPEGLPWYQKLFHGMADPAHGAVQLAAHLGMPGSTTGFNEFGGFQPPLPGQDTAYVPPSDLIAAEGDRSAAYNKARADAGDTGPDWWRLTGNLASPANFMLGPLGSGGNLAARIGTGMLQGGALGAIAPTDATDNYWKQKALDLTMGAGIGGIGSTIAPLVRGAVSTAQQLLQDAGMYLSPGAAGGKLASAAESTLSKVPILRGFVQGDRDQMFDSFNTALHNDVLSGIGDALPSGTKAGTDAYTYSMGAFNRAYNELLPQVTFRPGQTFWDGLQNIDRDVQLFPQTQQTQYYNLLNQRIGDRLTASGGVLSGDAMKATETDLRNFADKYAGQGGADGALGDAVNQVRTAMRAQLRDDYPDLAPTLSAIDRGYSRLATLKDAGLAATTQGAVPTPAQVLQSIARNANPNDVLRGGAPLQDIANAAQEVMGSSRSIGRSPATAGEMFLSELLSSRLGAGGALASAGASAGLANAPQSDYLPDWLRYGGAALLALPASRRLGNLAFSPGQVARSMAAQTPAGAATALPGLLGPQWQ